LQNKKIKLLERNQIELVFKEQELSLMLSPEGGSSRVKAGRLLKADLLVLLKAVERNGEDGRKLRYIEVVVSETGMGLRLVIGSVVLVDVVDIIEGDAAALEVMIRSGLKKYKEGIKEICAVPPFISDDLTRDYDYLQEAYAVLTEQALLRQPGVVVVELEEARAISRELELTGDGAAVRRNLPLYVLGRYRHNGLGTELRVGIGLELKRGEAKLQADEKKQVKPEEAAAYIGRSTQSMLTAVSGLDPAKPDPEMEVRQLAERGRSFLHIGSYKEALSLFEAGLLLKPDNTELHIDALHAGVMLLPAAYKASIDSVRADEALGYINRLLPHLRVFLNTDTALAQAATVNNYCNNTGFMSLILRAVINLKAGFSQAEVDRAVILLDNYCDVFVHNISDRIASGGMNETAITAIMNYYPTVTKYDSDIYQRHVYVGKLKILKAVAGQSFSLYFAHVITGLNNNSDGLFPVGQSAEYREFIEGIYSLPMAGATDLAEALYLGCYVGFPQNKGKERISSFAGKGSENIGKVVFTSLQPTIDGRVPHNYPCFTGWLACSNGMDVAWNEKDIYLMKDKDSLKKVFSLPAGEMCFKDVCFDGRSIWAPVIASEPLIVIIDPVTESIRRITVENGLPPMSGGLAAAPLETGKLALAGAFGRSWLAIVDISTDAPPSVKLLLEARTVPVSDKGDEELRVDNVFFPVSMAVVESPGKEGDRRILLARQDTKHGDALMVFNPADRSSFLMKDMRLDDDSCNYYCREGCVYGFSNPYGFLYRLGFPDFQKEIIGYLLGKRDDESYSLQYGISCEKDRILLLGRQCWATDPGGNLFRRLAFSQIENAYFKGIYRSSHYGFVCLKSSSYPESLYKAEFIFQDSSSREAGKR
ncbi:MAG: hypothetical protein PHT33_05065, partial [bacterium]|nr:hypothetical protein [bacterium]